ncbi:MAG TPA: TIM barrel protein [Fimbriimonadaceae bacterium]|nr:TIM barrel protein [Fimbriimonadaceae bacterium]
MTWGYSHVWPGQFLDLDAEPWIAKLKFLARHGFKHTVISLRDLADMPEKLRTCVHAELQRLDLALVVHIGLDWFAPPEAALEQIQSTKELLPRLVKVARAPLCVAQVDRYHRFCREPSLDHQLTTLSTALAPLSKVCQKLGAPLAVENGGRYRTIDLVRLCEATPHLGIFLDTGDCALVGETPVQACAIAAPKLLGFRLKDQRLTPRPCAHPPTLEMHDAPAGEGDLELTACFEQIRTGCPHFGKLLMEVGLVPHDFSGDEPLRELERTLQFLRRLEPAAGLQRRRSSARSAA